MGVLSGSLRRQAPALAVPRRGWGRLLRRSLPAYLLLLPFLIHFAVVVVYPFVYSIYLSFFQAGLNQDPSFVGLGNYVHLLADAEFKQSVANTGGFTVVVVLGQTVLALALAIAMNEPLRGRLAFRTASFVPVVTSWVAVSLIWVLIFSPSGLANQGLQALSRGPLPFFGDGRQAMAILMSVSVWKDLGYYMVIFLAALQAVPHEQVEAAAIDGANRLQSIWHVTVPSLRPVIYFVVSIATINAVQVFTQPYIMTDGGPLNATVSMVQELYRRAFVNLDFGYGSAIGTALLLILVTLSLLNKRASDWLER